MDQVLSKMSISVPESRAEEEKKIGNSAGKGLRKKKQRERGLWPGGLELRVPRLD